MLNHWEGEGRLVADPKLQHTQNGYAVVTVRIAVDRDVKEQDGTRIADFFDVTFWRGNAEFIDKYFRKGDSVILTGRLSNDNYTDKDGIERKVTKITAESAYFGKMKSTSSGAQKGSAQGEEGTLNYSQEEFPEIEADDELPF